MTRTILYRYHTCVHYYQSQAWPFSFENHKT